jgi:preprotein translocase SecE subunit
MKEFFSKAKSYLTEVKGEAKRVSWPGKRELYDSTLVVIAFIFILAVTTLVCDKAIQLFIQLVHAGA